MRLFHSNINYYTKRSGVRGELKSVVVPTMTMKKGRLRLSSAASMICQIVALPVEVFNVVVAKFFVHCLRNCFVRCEPTYKNAFIWYLASNKQHNEVAHN